MLVEPNPIPDDSVRIEHLGGYLYMLKQIYYCAELLSNKCIVINPFINYACLESLLLHTRVIDEFFTKTNWLETSAEEDRDKPPEKRKNRNYKSDDFLSIHCLTEEEYIVLHKELKIKGYILTDTERNLINKKMLHAAYDKKAIRAHWKHNDLTSRMLSAFKLFLTYKTPRDLIEKNLRWKDEGYQPIVNLLK